MNTVPTMTATEWQANVAERAAKELAHWVKTTDQSKLDWKPQIDGNQACRSVFEQIGECADILNGAAALLRDQPWPGGGEPFKTGDEACSALTAASKAFADALRDCDCSVLDKVFETPFGPAPGSFVINIVVGNLYYHGGQVNAIQMMLGDKEFHFEMT